MKDIGLEDMGISPTAISEPFPLFTEEAVRQMRAELFSKPVLDNHQYASSFASNMIRGYCPDKAPFIYDAWNDPEVLDAISNVAGIELVPAMNFDIGNVNISVNPEVAQTCQPPPADAKSEDMPAFGWHFDSFPFVCVTMLSDCAGMVGGETVIRTGYGDQIKFRGPTMGTAVVMQGRYIEHQALKALGGQERISMVTSFRPKSPFVKDETVLTGIRGISHVPEIYHQYAEYRLQILEERTRAQLKLMRKQHDAHCDFDIAGSRKFLTELRNFIDAMLEELTEIS